MDTLLVAAFYRFVELPDYEALRGPLLAACRAHSVRGTILLAAEGINGTIAGEPGAVQAVIDYLRRDPRFADLQYKGSQTTEIPFHRMKVKLKNEIVTLGVPDTDAARMAGTYLDAAEWNEMLADPDVLVIDTRNRYEVDIGSFPGAVSPQTTSFREFPAFVESQLRGQEQRKVAMFCTGGIRCEKATAYLRSQGFDDVFHLRGGILGYLESVPESDNRWQGDCFVFDERVAVDRNLEKADYVMCRACRRPVSPEQQASPDYVEAVSCPGCIDEYDDQRRQRFAERARQVRLAEQRGQKHIGVPMTGPEGDDEQD
ncbi:MAG: rhodanese-related sulfurtransferase [Gammaproteobacteria bacterium]|nr:rhodanese-related sulfurtransferase [Gammaproteobacteria bacterium]NND59802.1 rhodanese-related sulfurtransferase [Gammaproteobacteria bacterium]